MYSKLKLLLLGEPLHNHAEKDERLVVPIGLAVFASDALSSTAYATEEILIALAGSTAYLSYANLLSLPVAAAIAVLIAIVVISYRQVIRAFPEGGGAYVVSKAELGPLAAQVAGASLLIDYILTVAVSISAGVAAFTSTGLFPFHLRVPLALGLTLFITLVNLRGVRESGKAFAIPAYIFLLSMACMIGYGLWQAFNGQVVPQTAGLAAHTSAASGLSLSDLALNGALVLVLLKAFSHGCAALTGIESIASGVKAFKEPADVRANITMSIMGVLLATIFIGVTYLTSVYQILPKHEETVISQVARAVFGGENFFYYLVQFSTMVLLILAANTGFAGFPRLASMLANDALLPRQLMSLGDRLVFSNGIVLLGLLSSVLILIFHGDTHALIPLYAVGVFMSFTLSQAGMVRHRKRLNIQNEQLGSVINAVGAVVTGLVTLILIFEKFTEGAWIILIAIPLIISVFRSISAHYASVGRQLALPVTGYCPTAKEHTVLVLVSSLNRGTIPALEYGKSISKNVEAVHVQINPQATKRLRAAWDEWGCGIPLTILNSPYRSITEPLLDYIDEVEGRHEHDLVTIIVPEFVTRKWWHYLLHNQTAILLKALLRFRRGKVVTTVRYHLED